MSQPLSGSSHLNVNYTLMTEPKAAPYPQTTSKVDQVYHEHIVSGEYKVNHEATSILSQANNHSKSGNNAYNEKRYHAAYLYYLEAKKLYDELPKNEESIRKLIQVNYDLAWTAQAIRQERRATVIGTAMSISLIITLPLAIYYCFQLQSTSWVNNGTFRSYIENGLSLVDSLIQIIEKNNKIQMNTDKNSIPSQVRKDLAKAYKKKEEFYSINETIPPHTCWGKVNIDCLSDCCFEGTNGTQDASMYDAANRIANLKLAKEWDPTNTEYESLYQRLDASMRTPIVLHYR